MRNLASFPLVDEREKRFGGRLENATNDYWRFTSARREVSFFENLAKKSALPFSRVVGVSRARELVRIPRQFERRSRYFTCRRSRAESQVVQILSSSISTQPQQNALKRIQIAEIDQHLAAAASAELDLHRRGEQIG